MSSRSLSSAIVIRCISLIAAFILNACAKGDGSSISDNDLSEHRLPDTLRVATLYSPSSFFIFRDQRMGYDYELVRDMTAAHDMELDLNVASSLAVAVEWLDSGKVDLIAFEVPVTAEYADHAIPCGVESVTHQVLVQPRKGSDIISDVTQLIGRDIYVEADSKYHQRLINLDQELGGGIAIHTIDSDTVIAEDLIDMVNAGKIPLTIVDSDIAAVNRTYYPTLDISLALSLDQKAAWAVAPSRKWLADSIDSWLSAISPRRNHALLLRRYFELAKNDPTVYTLDFSKGYVSPFDNLFKKGAAESGWDWRLLAAQAFVESRFDSSQVSWAGAKGIMQIMPATARAYDVVPSRLTDNSTSINLAIKILDALDRSLASKVPDVEERRKFVLAAYNSGLAHINDAIALARITGKNPQIWYGNVESALLLKSNPEFYNNPVCKYGYFHGRQTTHYVRSVSEIYEKIKSKFTK